MPVLAEGPLDAISITLAAEGTEAGIAPLGAEFICEQAAHFQRYFRDEPSRMIVATDLDAAGSLSA
jgi:DNA primase